MVVKVLPVAWRLPFAAVFFLCVFFFLISNFNPVNHYFVDLHYASRAMHQIFHYLLHHITRFLTSGSTNQPLTSLDSVFQFV